MTPDQQLRAALRSGNAEQIADLAELMQAESLPPRRKIAAAVDVLEASAQRHEARRVVWQGLDGVQHVDPTFAPLRWNPDTHEMEQLHGLSAADIAEMQARCDEQRIDRDTNAGMCN